MTPVSVEEDQLQVELELSEASAGADGSQADLPPQAVPEQTYDSLFPALPMGSTKPARAAAPSNAAPMMKVSSSNITQVSSENDDESVEFIY